MTASVPLSLLALGLLTLLSSCDSTAQEAGPVMLVNDTDRLVVYTSRHLSSMIPDVYPGYVISDTSNIGDHLRILHPHDSKTLTLGCRYYEAEEPDRQTLGMRDGWIARVYVYKPLSSGESFEQMASYSFWSNDSIIELLIENSCRIRISDVDFLERLADMSGP